MRDTRRKAYTVVLAIGGYILGRADEGVDGYTPQHEVFGVFESYNAARGKADELNETLGLSKREAARIVLTTMRGSLKPMEMSKGIGPLAPARGSHRALVASILSDYGK